MRQDAAAWPRLSEALADALELPHERRDALLAERFADAPELLAEARALLAAEAAAGRLEPREHAPLAARLDAEGAADPWLGRVLDRWRLLEPLGAGGMGSVYLAERTDAAFEQRVALKLLRASLTGEDGRARFRTEQRALARLEHSGIVRLIDGGVTPEGIPYLVTEHVDGLAVDRWCDAHALEVRGRVKLFLQICDAVRFAHSNLVVHRDLKPSNVLVDREGRARLLDFGIARLLDAGAQQGDDATRTRTELRALTPRYASPEQVRGEPVSTASDVYSLGVVLYELLTGRAPYAVPTGAPSQVESAICDSRPERPSTVVTGGDGARAGELAALRQVDPASLRRALAGDLDAVVLRCLAKEPERRYAGAGELRDDLARWLDGLPVHARPDSLGYRARTFVRRHRLAVGAVLAVFAALSLGLVSTWRQYRSARSAELAERDARELAERRLADLREIATSLILDVHDRIRPDPGTLAAREAVLSAATGYLERLEAELPDDPALALELARAWVRLGDALGEPARANLGRPDEARACYERALAAARSHGDSVEAQECAVLARGRLGELELRAGDVARAEDELRDALSTRRQLDGARADDAANLLDEAALRCRMADVLFESGQLDEAERELQGALELLDPESDDLQQRYHAALASWRLGRIAERRGDAAGAEAAYGASLEWTDAVLAAGSRDLDHLRHALLSCLDLARARARSGDSAQALEFAQRGLETARELRQADPRSARARDDEALALNLLAELATAAGDHERASERYEEALELRRGLLDDSPASVEARRNVAKNLDFLGTALTHLGRADEAAMLHGEALEAFEELARADPSNAEARRSVAVSANWLGESLHACAARPDRPAPSRAADLEAAREAFAHAREVLEDLRSEGRLAPADAGVCDLLDERIAECERELAPR